MDERTLAPGGCPCGTYGPCCDAPDPYGGHDLFCDCGDEDCDCNWWLRCGNCGAECECGV